MSDFGKTQEKYPKFMEDQRAFFDELVTREWGSYHNPEWDRTRRYEVDRLFEQVQPKTVLDVGCGCGFHDLLMAQKPGVEAVTGIDYSAKSIEAANRAYPHALVTREVRDIMSMPAGHHDLVVSFQVIEHLKETGRFLEACASQARPDGWVAVVTPNRLRLSNRVRRLLGRPEQLGDPQHWREFSAKELRQIGESARLRYDGYFAYGISISLPSSGKRLLPVSAGLSLGYHIPAIADCFCLIFRNDS